MTASTGLALWRQGKGRRRPEDTGEAGARAQMRARRIVKSDFQAVAALLHEGFSHKPVRYFTDVLLVLTKLERIGDEPTYGFVLEADGEVVGTLLTIATHTVEDGNMIPRLNVSCWYVRPRYRLFAGILAARIGTKLDTAILNVSPAPYTFKTIEAQGFRRFSNGVFAGIPALALGSRSAKVRRLEQVGTKPYDVTEGEWRILQEHAHHGCTSCVCIANAGSFPFVFRRRRVRGMPVEGAQLIYCRDISTVGLFARALGIFLTSRGMPWLLVPGNGAIAGVPGVYIANKWPMYAKGRNAGRIGDLAYTENAIFGF